MTYQHYLLSLLTVPYSAGILFIVPKHLQLHSHKEPSPLLLVLQRSSLKMAHKSNPFSKPFIQILQFMLENSQLNRITFCYFLKSTFHSQSTLTSSHSSWNATSRCNFFYFPIKSKFNWNTIFK